ncbi:MAG: protein kinase [Deltaproteobacteria bacterium]|nr:protein kinase [Deltaproteobacteria bacterium]
MESRDREEDGSVVTGVRPGALTALLREIAGAAAPATPARLEAVRAGLLVERYELVRELGRGAFGVVWEARDVKLGRSVAFKLVRPGRARVGEEQLQREAEAIARLSHPNLVTLHDVGRCPQGPYLVLELLRGATLEARLAQGPVPPREAVQLALGVARGLAHAHAQGVVHRDLKPSNVFLCQDGQLKVLDFGMAHAFGRMRVDGGTPGYMAPEQWRGAPEDERTDVFSLGVMLYRMLAGELPFPGDGGRSTTGPDPAPEVRVPEVPGLGPLVGRMLSQDPVGRPRNGSELLEELQALAPATDRSSSGTSLRVVVRRKQARRLRLAAGAAAALLVAGGIAVVGGMVGSRWHGPRPRPAAGADGRVVVAVADFANESQDPELDGLSVLLITSLEQSRSLRILTRGAMVASLRQLGKEASQRIDETLAREVGARVGASALLLGSVRKVGGVYAVEVRAVDPARDDYLFTVQEQASGKQGVLDALDRLSQRTRERLHETPDEVEATRIRVSDVTPASFAVWQHYFRGLREEEAEHYREAVEAFQSAVAADPAFALGHYRIAYLGETVGLSEAARRTAMEAAVRHADRVPAKERLFIQAWKAHADGRSQEAHDLYARAAEAYPQDVEALYLAGDRYFHEGRYDEALPWFERAVAVDPAWYPALDRLADVHWMAGRRTRYQERARQYVARAPVSARSLRTRAWLLWSEGNRPEALAAARRALELDRGVTTAYDMGTLLIADDRFGEAEELLRPLAAPSASVFERTYSIQLLASAVAHQGRRREALQIVDTFPSDAPDGAAIRRWLRVQLLQGEADPGPALRELREHMRQARPEQRATASGFCTALVWLGDLDGAEAFLRELQAGSHQALCRATLALRRGQAAQAVGQLQALRADANLGVRAAAWWWLALAAHEAGDDATALLAADEHELISGKVWRSWGMAEMQLLRARAHERRGEPEKARAAVERLLAWWKRPEPNQPRLAEAREIRARVGGLRVAVEPPRGAAR